MRIIDKDTIVACTKSTYFNPGLTRYTVYKDHGDAPSTLVDWIFNHGNTRSLYSRRSDLHARFMHELILVGGVRFITTLRRCVQRAISNGRADSEHTMLHVYADSLLCTASAVANRCNNARRADVPDIYASNLLAVIMRYAWMIDYDHVALGRAVFNVIDLG